MTRRWLRVLPVAVVLLYCLPVLAAGLHMLFAPDDMMNLHKYWRQGLTETALANLQFWSTSYRPLGGLFYLSIFSWAGLDPFPYRLVLMFVLLANALLAYHAARLLVRSRWLAMLAAVLAWFNVDAFDTHYVTSSLYDVLCYCFYLAGFVLWVSARQRGRRITVRRAAAVAILYVAALNSKEMGVTLPLVLGAYELAFHGWRAILDRRVLAPITGLCIMGAGYSIGKMTGPDSLSDVGAYQPVFTLERFLDNNAGFASELVFHQSDLLGKTGVIALWGLLAYLGYRRRIPALRLAVLFAILASLPLAFIPRRGGSSIYLLWFPYALALAVIAASVIRFLSREPLFRWLRIRPVFARTALTLVLMVCAFAHMQHHRKDREPLLLHEQRSVQAVIQQMKDLNPRPRNGAKVLFLKDPFELHDMYFIAALTFRDPSVEIIVQRMHPVQVDPATADHVFTYEDGRLVRIR